MTTVLVGARGEDSRESVASAVVFALAFLVARAAHYALFVSFTSGGFVTVAPSLVLDHGSDYNWTLPVLYGVYAVTGSVGLAWFITALVNVAVAFALGLLWFRLPDARWRRALGFGVFTPLGIWALGESFWIFLFLLYRT